MSRTISGDYDVDDDYYDEEYERQLAEERRRREEEQCRLEEERRREEERRCLQLDQEIAISHSQLAELRSVLVLEAKALILEAGSLFSSSYGIDITEKALHKIITIFEAIPGTCGKRSSAVMAAYLQQIKGYLATIVTCRNGEYSNATGVIRKEIKDHKIATGEKEFLSHKFVKAAKKSFSLDAPKKAAVKVGAFEVEKKLRQEANKYFEMVSAYLHNPFVANKNEITHQIAATEKLIASEKVDDQYKLSQIELRRKTFLVTKDKYDREIKQFKNLQTQFSELQAAYCVLCNMLGVESKSYVYEVEKAFDLIAELKKEVEQKKERLAGKKASEYVARSINEVMLELGHDIIATDFIKKTKRNIIHHIYEFDNENVVNVYTSDNGSLMFEVTGAHNGHQELDSDEKQKIKSSMESLCDKYPHIKERMSAKGIQINFEDIKPADIQYARVIDLTGKKKVKEKESRKRKSVQERKIRQKRL